MNIAVFDALLEHTHGQRCKLMTGKRHDYAQDADILSNFKLVAATCGVTPCKVIEMFLATKVVRLANLSARGDEAANESQTDTILDIHNYADLWLAARQDADGS